MALFITHNYDTGGIKKNKHVNMSLIKKIPAKCMEGGGESRGVSQMSILLNT